MKHLNIVFYLMVGFLLNGNSLLIEGAELEMVSDDDLLNLFKNEKHVVVLFTKSKCQPCDAIEKILIESRDELVDHLGAWVVKASGSSLLRLYSPSSEPALVFFRHGTPMLYDGPIEEDYIVQTFIDNKEPNVRELTDDTFEHLTQAASGSTTGDWFVMFYTTSCFDCQRLGARLEAVGAAGRARGLLVARADRQGAASATARRFGVTKDPTFILFRKGKMYWYDLPKYDIKSFTTFTQDWYKNAKSERVPLPKSPFDDLVAWCVYMIRDILDLVVAIITDHPWLLGMAGLGFGLVAITSIISYVKARRSLSESTKSPSAKATTKQTKKQSKKKN